MKLSFLNIAFLIALLNITILFSQEKVDSKLSDTIIPHSIYSIKSTTPSFISKYSLNNRLNFEQYQFLFLDKKSIENGYYAFPITHLGRKPSMFIYETYKDIYDKRNLEISFFDLSKLYLPYIPEK
jgi:hypothetical protein